MPSNPKNTRRCCACREYADKSELIRIVRRPDGGIAVDPSKKANGRGVWVHAKAECVDRLKKKKLLNVAFKTNVPQEVYEEIDVRQ